MENDTAANSRPDLQRYQRRGYHVRRESLIHRDLFFIYLGIDITETKGKGKNRKGTIYRSTINAIAMLASPSTTVNFKPCQRSDPSAANHGIYSIIYTEVD